MSNTVNNLSSFKKTYQRIPYRKRIVPLLFCPRLYLSRNRSVILSSSAAVFFYSSSLAFFSFFFFFFFVCERAILANIIEFLDYCHLPEVIFKKSSHLSLVSLYKCVPTCIYVLTRILYGSGYRTTTLSKKKRNIKTFQTLKTSPTFLLCLSTL